MPVWGYRNGSEHSRVLWHICVENGIAFRIYVDLRRKRVAGISPQDDSLDGREGGRPKPKIDFTVVVPPRPSAGTQATARGRATKLADGLEPSSTRALGYADIIAAPLPLLQCVHRRMSGTACRYMNCFGPIQSAHAARPPCYRFGRNANSEIDDEDL